jgi:hypothetical protein
MLWLILSVNNITNIIERQGFDYPEIISVQRWRGELYHVIGTGRKSKSPQGPASQSTHKTNPKMRRRSSKRKAAAVDNDDDQGDNPVDNRAVAGRGDIDAAHDRKEGHELENVLVVDLTEDTHQSCAMSSSADVGSNKVSHSGSSSALNEDMVVRADFVSSSSSASSQSAAPVAPTLTLLTATGTFGGYTFRSGGDTYNLMTGAWGDLPLMEYGRTFSTGCVLTSSLNGDGARSKPTFVVVGGTRVNPRGRGELYLKSCVGMSPGENTWRNLRPMPGDQRCAHSAVAVKESEDGVITVRTDDDCNTMYVFGGITPKRSGNSDVFKYNINANKWEIMPSLLNARHGAGATCVDNKVFALGGDRDSSIEYFDSITNTWTLLDSVSPLERYYFACAAASRRKSIFCIGGYINSGITNTGQYLNVETRQWHQMSNMPIALTAMPAVYCADNDLIYVAGGRTSSPNPSSVALSNAMYVYDIRSDTWNHLVNLPVAAIENVVMSIARW